MPWITVTIGPQQDAASPARLASDVTEAAAAATGLLPSDVVTFVHVAAATSGPGATVLVAGRRRADAVESALLEALARAVSQRLDISPGLVATVRV